MTLAPEPATVVVGVDGPTGSRDAIIAAAQEAGYRGATLVAVRAYSENPMLGAPAGRPLATMHAADDERLAAQSALCEAVLDALGDQANMVELRTVSGLAGRNLVEQARRVNAQLIVLAGRRGTAPLRGSVSQYVLRKAPCPVLVVPTAG
jgi:nucleotide-binding universal stress UspA family protein